MISYFLVSSLAINFILIAMIIKIQNLYLNHCNTDLIEDQLETLQEKIMTALSQLAPALDALTAQVNKVNAEVVNVKNALAALQEALANTTLPAEAETALLNLQASLQALDDLNPDAPVV